MANLPSQSEKSFTVRQVTAREDRSFEDWLTVEEPMEVRVVFGPQEKRTGRSLSITMRTPGMDVELAAGFLFTEGVLSDRNEIVEFEVCGPVAEGRSEGNTIRVYLRPDVELDVQKFQRHFYTTSSCGVCGKGSLDAIRNLGTAEIPDSGQRFDVGVLKNLPGVLRESQESFEKTGGIHAAGLFDTAGELISICEDVGRHNALDKLIGKEFLEQQVPMTGKAIVVSGRASFELVQKTVVAGAELLIAVGAPSSLAVELSREFNLTLVGFASAERLNIYSGEFRVCSGE